MAVDSEYTVRVLNLWRGEDPQRLLEEVRNSLNDIISESANFYPTFVIDNAFAAELYSCAVNGLWYDLLPNMMNLSQNFKNLVFYVDEKSTRNTNGYVFYAGDFWMRGVASPFDQLSGEAVGTDLPPAWIRDLMMSYSQSLSDD